MLHVLMVSTMVQTKEQGFPQQRQRELRDGSKHMIGHIIKMWHKHHLLGCLCRNTCNNHEVVGNANIWAGCDVRCEQLQERFVS